MGQYYYNMPVCKQLVLQFLRQETKHKYYTFTFRIQRVNYNKDNKVCSHAKLPCKVYTCNDWHMQQNKQENKAPHVHIYKLQVHKSIH